MEEAENQFPENVDRRRPLDNSCDYPRFLHLVWHERLIVVSAESSKSTAREKAFEPFDFFLRGRNCGERERERVTRR